MQSADLDGAEVNPTGAVAKSPARAADRAPIGLIRPTLVVPLVQYCSGLDPTGFVALAGLS
jgi:hypothetical protein